MEKEMQLVEVPVTFKFLARPGVDIEVLKNYLLMTLDEANIEEGIFNQDGSLNRVDTELVAATEGVNFMLTGYEA